MFPLGGVDKIFATNGSKKHSAFRGRGGVWGGETLFSREKRVSPPRKSSPLFGNRAFSKSFPSFPDSNHFKSAETFSSMIASTAAKSGRSRVAPAAIS